MNREKYVNILIVCMSIIDDSIGKGCNVFIIK